MEEETDKNLKVVTVGGIKKWFARFFSIVSFAGCCLILVTSIAFPEQPILGVGNLLMALFCFVFGRHIWMETTRPIHRWNSDTLIYTMRRGAMQKYRWDELTDVRPSADGIGRAFTFRSKGVAVIPHQTASMNDIFEIDAFEREKMKENARTARS